MFAIAGPTYKVSIVVSLVISRLISLAGRFGFGGGVIFSCMRE